MWHRKIIVNDKMQKGYCYEISQPMGENFQPDFQPELTPRQMLALGVFGGRYLRDCKKEFPADWFKGARLLPEGMSGHDKSLNFFGVNASQSLTEWRRKGWIHEDDPRGWFQWYCRYFIGRRHRDDARQIKRWKAFRRHAAAVRNKCFPHDFSCNTRQRQALLHWAYDSRKI
jgi:hypothetical protein